MCTGNRLSRSFLWLNNRYERKLWNNSKKKKRKDSLSPSATTKSTFFFVSLHCVACILSFDRMPVAVRLLILSILCNAFSYFSVTLAPVFRFLAPLRNVCCHSSHQRHLYHHHHHRLSVSAVVKLSRSIRDTARSLSRCGRFSRVCHFSRAVVPLPSTCISRTLDRFISALFSSFFLFNSIFDIHFVLLSFHVLDSISHLDWLAICYGPISAGLRFLIVAHMYSTLRHTRSIGLDWKISLHSAGSAPITSRRLLFKPFSVFRRLPTTSSSPSSRFCFYFSLFFFFGDLHVSLQTTSASSWSSSVFIIIISLLRLSRHCLFTAPISLSPSLPLNHTHTHSYIQLLTFDINLSIIHHSQPFICSCSINRLCLSTQSKIVGIINRLLENTCNKLIAVRVSVDVCSRVNITFENRSTRTR